MKNLIKLSFLFATTAVFASDYDNIANLSSDTATLAQNAIIVAEKSDGAEASLLKALASKDPLIKDTAIYALASIHSEKSFANIADLAKKGDKTAIYALVKYGDKAVDTLKALADKNEDAKQALLLACSKMPELSVPDMSAFNAADENGKVCMLRNLELNAKGADFLSKVDCSSERIAYAVITTYAKIGGNDSVKQILKVQADNKLDAAATSKAVAILAACSNGDQALIEAAKAGNTYAISSIRARRVGAAEDTLLELAKSTDSNVKKEAFDALTTCGGSKTMDFFANTISSASDADLGLYVKAGNAIYLGLDKASAAKFKDVLTQKAGATSGKTKAAIERILTVPAAPAKKGRRK